MMVLAALTALRGPLGADDDAPNPAAPAAKTIPTPPGLTNAPVLDPAAQERRQRAREIVAKYREEQRTVTEKLRQARRDLELAAQADPPDEANVRAKAAVVGQLEGDLALIRGKQYRALRADGLQPSPVDALSRTNNRLHQIVPRIPNKPLPPGEPPRKEP